MELRRTLILVAMAVVGYMLILDWQKDYGGTTPATTTANVPAASGVPSPPTPVAGNSDTPSLPVAPATTPAAAPTPTVALTGTVHVHTDVLDLQIDPKGGDIVDLRLPQYTTVAGGQEPFHLLEDDADRQYIAQSGLIGPNGTDPDDTHRALYQSAASHYELPAGQNSLDVVLSLPAKDGVQIDKVFHFTRGSYLLNVSYRINNQGSKSWDGFLYGQLKRDNSKDPSVSGSRFGGGAFLGGAWSSPDRNYNKLAFDKFSDKGEALKESMKGGWIAIVQHYFISAWVPDQTATNQFETHSEGGSRNYIYFVSAPLHADAGKTATVSASLYAGPKVQSVLKAISPGLDLTVDYGRLWIIAQALFAWMTIIFGFIGNWGWTIVLLTLSIKLAFFWLSARSYRSMANMRRVMPEMQRIKELYANDRQKLGTATMELYKKEGVNPLGGCLPILVQIPVFMALYATLGEAVELRHAHWLWITDLSITDPLFALPIAMGISMFGQQMLNPPPPDPTQAKVMKLMPIMFTFMFLWLPAGLALYMLVNNLLSIAQQWVITRNVEKAAEAK